MRERIIKIALVLIMVLVSSMPMLGCRSGDSYAEFFRLNECGESWTILDWAPNENGHLEIPAYHSGKPVTRIDGQFNGAHVGPPSHGATTSPFVYTTSIFIPYTVERIEDDSFRIGRAGLGTITGLNFGANSRLEHIGDYAFYGRGFRSPTYSGKFTLEFPEGLKSIGAFAFSNGSLSSGRHSFNSLVLPHSLESVATRAFSNSNFMDIYIGKNLNSIAEGVFTNNLLHNGGIEVHEENEYFYVRNGNLFDRNRTLLVGNNFLDIPNGTKRIGERAFYRVSAINNNINTTVSALTIIPPSVTSIGADAFRNRSFIGSFVDAHIVVYNEAIMQEGWVFSKIRDVSIGRNEIVENPWDVPSIRKFYVENAGYYELDFSFFIYFPEAGWMQLIVEDRIDIRIFNYKWQEIEWNNNALHLEYGWIYIQMEVVFPWGPERRIVLDINKIN